MAPDDTPLIFRAPLRSRSDAIPTGPTVERAVRLSLCGMGGVLAAVPRDLTEAVAAASREHDERLARRLARFAQAPDGSLVWTRDPYDEFRLGRVSGEWRYDASPEAAAVDLVHVRTCAWQPAPIAWDEVPDGVRATFARGGRNWQRIHDDEAARLSARLWERGVSRASP